jgi:hypothetical protein
MRVRLPWSAPSPVERAFECERLFEGQGHTRMRSNRRAIAHVFDRRCAGVAALEQAFELSVFECSKDKFEQRRCDLRRCEVVNIANEMIIVPLFESAR